MMDMTGAESWGCGTADPDYELDVLLREELDRHLSGPEDGDFSVFGRC